MSSLQQPYCTVLEDTNIHSTYTNIRMMLVSNTAIVTVATRLTIIPTKLDKGSPCDGRTVVEGDVMLTVVKGPWDKDGNSNIRKKL